MAYEDRVWLAQYRAETPPDIPLGGEGGSPPPSPCSRPRRAEHGDKPLIHYAGTTLTVGEVDRMSDALAAGLLADGFAPGDRIAVFLQNIPQFAIAVLAAWKAGGIVVPVNPMNKERELTYAIEDSGATVHRHAGVAVHRRRQQGRAAGPARHHDERARPDHRRPAAERVRGVDAQPLGGDARTCSRSCADHDGEEPPAIELGPDDVAFLTYTSGTTGVPKGAMNTHGNVVFNSEAYRRWMDLTPEDSVLGIAPLFHITGIVAHLTVSLLVPMPLVLGFRFDPGNMLDLIERWRPTFTVGAITAFIALMNDPSWDGRDLSSLTKVYSGGAPIAPATVERFQREAGAYIHNIYGLTETTSPSHGVPMGGHAPTDPKSGALSVGVPIFNTIVRVIDEEGNEVEAGRARRVRHQRAAGRGRLLEQARGDRARPARVATCTPATSGSWTPTAGTTSSTARRT